MDSESSYIALSVWGSPLSPTETLITEDQQPAPANTNLFYHKKNQKKPKILSTKRCGTLDAKKRTIGEKVARREKRLPKITEEKKSCKTF